MAESYKDDPALEAAYADALTELNKKLAKEVGAPLRWQDWRPRNKWIIVKADPRVKKTKGGIELPDRIVAVERVMEGTGRILRVGDRHQIVQATCGVELEPGMRICFRGFLKDAFQEFEQEDGCPVFLLRAEDVMAIIGDDVEMGAFS